MERIPTQLNELNRLHQLNQLNQPNQLNKLNKLNKLNQLNKLNKLNKLNILYNSAPQYLQCFASGSWPSWLHCGQAWVETLFL